MGDTEGASQQAQASSDHTARAQQHVCQAKKMVASGAVSVLRGTADAWSRAMPGAAMGFCA